MSRDFWSRRRAAVEAESRAEEDARAEAARRDVAARLEERPDAEILGELGLPDPDEMERPEQVQDLLRAAVPQRLKTRALRRLWRLNPVLANVDGLVEYGENYADSATVLENMQTAYVVGKGMLERFETLAAEAPERAAMPAAEAQPETATEAAEAPPPPPTEAPAPPAADIREPQDMAESADPRAPSRRMRFRFDAVT